MWFEQLGSLRQKFESVQEKLLQLGVKENEFFDDQVNFDNIIHESGALNFRAKKSSNSTASRCTPDRPSTTLKIPKLSLPKFSGAISEWCKYLQPFQS